MDRHRTLRVKASGFFALRTPLLPFDDALEWSAGLEAPLADDDLDAAVKRDGEVVRERLKDAFARPEVKQAIAIASPEFATLLESSASGSATPRADGAMRTLARYLWRMATRATPFGLFAGISTGVVGRETILELPPLSGYKRVSRLDCNLLERVLAALADSREVRAELVYRANPTLQPGPGGVRFVATRRDQQVRTHHLVTVPDTLPLRDLLSRAEDGADLCGLTETLTGTGVDAERARSFVEQMVRLQVLVPDLALAVTSEDPLRLLVQELQPIPAAAVTVRVLSQAADLLAEVDAARVGATEDRSRDLEELLADLPVKVDASSLVRVDLLKPAVGLTLGERIVDEIAASAHLLHLAARPPQPSDLDVFRDRLVQRYEQRAVPLLEALDPDLGVGFGAVRDNAPLLRGVPFGSEVLKSSVGTPIDELLLEKVSAALAAGEEEITLGLGELEDHADPEKPPLPLAFSVHAAIGALSHEALEGGDFEIVVQGVSGPSGARALGRFCHADPALRVHVQAHLQAEEALDPEAVHAEIVHLPHGRVGNLAVRPSMRPYEIPCLGRSAVRKDEQIPVTDLLVAVRDGRIELQSIRLGRRVVPRLTSAHNFDVLSVPLYRFLCSLQAEGTTGHQLAWSWGPLRSAPFLPRVRVGRVVLAPARWRVARSDVDEWARRTRTDLFRGVRDWRRQHGVPRLAILTERASKLPVDFDNVVSVEAFAHALRVSGGALVEEMRPPPDLLCTFGPEGRFSHEVIVPFVATSPRRTRSESRRVAGNVRRRFVPGSEWVYAKLYSAGTMSDLVLRDILSPLRDELVLDGTIERWFFLRYCDPEQHLRMRFRGDAEGLRRRLQDWFGEAVDAGLAWRLQFDTYERELERFGGPDAIELSEGIFHADSEAVLALLSRFEPGDTGAEERWLIGLRGVDQLLIDAGLDLHARLHLALHMKASLATALRADGRTESALSRSFRSSRGRLEALLDRSQDETSELGAGLEVIAERSYRLRPNFASLHALGAAGRLGTSLEALVASHAHMFLNRLCRSRNTAHEFVIYDFLARLYRSSAARLL